MALIDRTLERNQCLEIMNDCAAMAWLLKTVKFSACEWVCVRGCVCACMRAFVCACFRERERERAREREKVKMNE